MREGGIIYWSEESFVGLMMPSSPIRTGSAISSRSLGGAKRSLTSGATVVK